MATRTTDFLLDDTGDLVIALGDLALASEVVGIRQSIKSRLQFFMGEWFLDEDRGIPYYQNIFIKNPSLVTVREIYRGALEETPGVKDIYSLDIANIGSRKITVDWNISTDVGELVGTTNGGV